MGSKATNNNFYFWPSSEKNSYFAHDEHALWIFAKKPFEKDAQTLRKLCFSVPE
jgi:hypothetical protein